MIYVVAFLVGLLCGSIPFGLIIVRLVKGTDIRKHGSGNIGATNVFRIAGKGPGLAAFFLDVAKGFLPALIFKQAFGVNVGIAAGLGAIAGHVFTPFLRFKGGKGVATSLGVFIGLAPIASAVGFGIWVVLLLVFGWVSLASMIAAISVPVFLIVSRNSRFSEFGVGILCLAIAATLILIARHVGNIKRLVRGKEPRFAWRKEAEKDRG
jgi:glycerol-3-phosphate acyltransferase PlsY